MINHQFTGQSSVSYEEAIAAALYAASDFLKNMHNAHVDIQDLWQDPKEDYHALLDITKDPLAPAYTEEEFQSDEKLGDHPNADQKFRFFRRKGYNSLKSLIADHFKKRGKAAPSGIPDFIIAHLTATDIENNAIEKDFLFAAEAMPVPVEEESHSPANDLEKYVVPPGEGLIAEKKALPQT